MNEPEQFPPELDEQNQDEPVVGPREVKRSFDNVWLGLVGGLVLLTLAVGVSLSLPEGLSIFLTLCSLVLLFRFLPFIGKRKRLFLGLLLSLGVFVLLCVGGCVLYLVVYGVPAG